jgi:hypothetical protein
VWGYVEGVTGDWGKLRNEELRDLHLSKVVKQE